MVHSGSCTGKKWRVDFKQKNDKCIIDVVEKFGSCEAIIFSTSKNDFGEKWLRPQRCVDLLEDFLASHPTFNYESHVLKVIGKTFNRPLVFEKEK